MTDPPSAQRNGGTGASVATGTPAVVAKPGLPVRSSVAANVIAASNEREVTGSNERVAAVTQFGREAALPEASQSKEPLARVIDAGAGAPRARIVTGPPSAQRNGGAGAIVATGAPAAVTQSGLPPRSGVAAAYVIAAGNEREAMGTNERVATAARSGRAEALPRASQSKEPLRVIVADAGAPRAAAATVAHSAMRNDAFGADVATGATPVALAPNAVRADARTQSIHPKRLIAVGEVDEETWSHAVKMGSILSVEQARQIVVAARDRVRVSRESRRARMDTPASPDTLEDYRKKCERIDAVVRATDGNPIKALTREIGKHASVRQTFQTTKSAVRTLTLERVRLLLTEQDKLQRAKATLDESQWMPKWLAVVWMLGWGLAELAAVDGLNREECLRSQGARAAPSKSKRKLLPRLDSGWRERFMDVNSRSHTYRDPGVLLRFAGVRPQELEWGVRLRWTESGIRVRVAGAKVRETAGQPWRSLSLDISALPDWFVKQIPRNRSVVVQAKADPMRSHLGRKSQPVLNPSNRKGDIKDMRLSAYLFRHALVSDLRAAGWTPEDIAPVLGESSAATANLYGTAHTTGTVRPAIVVGSVRAPRVIKPLDRAGLQQVVRRQEKVSRSARRGSRSG